MKTVLSDLDFFLPFRQHAPSLANARREIYADVNRFPGKDGAGFFNVLAFRGVFFGSPFAQSDRFQWFNTFADWEKFLAEGKEVAEKHGKDGKEENYYVKRNCYGQSQTDRSIKLLAKYWDLRLEWSAKFDTTTEPSITEIYKWLSTSNPNIPNIGSLSALLICGDLIEAGILPMPTALEFSGLIYSLKMGARSAMETLGLISKQTSRAEITKAFTSLDLALQQELKEEEKEAMGYNVIMLEHSLCKIKRLNNRGFEMKEILQEI
jgi:hypothetical protein